MAGIMCAAVGGSYITSAVVTVGSSTPSPGVTYYGFESGVMGSVSPATWNSQSILIIRQDTYLGSLNFTVNGVFPNAGWETMTVDGTPFSRTSASYAVVGGSTRWSWNSGGNPFGTTVGAAKTVTWI